MTRPSRSSRPRVGRAALLLLVWVGAAGLACQEGTDPIAPPPPVGVDAAISGDAQTPVDEAPPDPSLSFSSGFGNLQFRGAGEVRSECIGSHKGVEGKAGGDRLYINAFVFKPGTYRCAESDPYIFLYLDSAVLSSSYANTPSEGGGDCEIRIESIRPRLVATFDAAMEKTRGPGPNRVNIANGRVDVPFPFGDGCP